MKKIMKLITVFIILFSFVRCSGSKAKDYLEFDQNAIGTIDVNFTKSVVLKVRRVNADYKYVWMGIKELGYQTESVNIEHLATGDNIHDVTVNFNVPIGTVSGWYILYAKMGKGDHVGTGALELSCDDECIYVEGDLNPPSPISVNLEFLTDSPINYQIKDQSLFQVSLKTRIRSIPPGGVWVRVFLEVTMPPVNQKFKSNYYTYYLNSDFHWENITLEFGGGSYSWDGDMSITARVKLYDAWPGGKEIIHTNDTFSL